LTESQKTVDELKASEVEHKKVEEVVSRLSEANYSAIFNAANDAIFVQDIETGQIIDVNDKHARCSVTPRRKCCA